MQFTVNLTYQPGTYLPRNQPQCNQADHYLIVMRQGDANHRGAVVHPYGVGTSFYTFGQVMI